MQRTPKMINVCLTFLCFMCALVCSACPLSMILSLTLNYQQLLFGYFTFQYYPPPPPPACYSVLKISANVPSSSEMIRYLWCMLRSHQTYFYFTVLVSFNSWNSYLFVYVACLLLHAVYFLHKKNLTH